MREMAKLEIEGRMISKKNSKRIICRGNRPRVLSSVAYEAFKESALWQLKKAAREGMVRPPYCVDYIFCIKGKHRIDKDNAEASINDILQEAGLIDDDENILTSTSVKVRQCKEWRTHIWIKSIDEVDVKKGYTDIYGE